MTSPRPPIDPRVLISWDGSGLFTGPYDDVTAATAATPGVTVDEGRDAAQTLAPPKISAGSLELFNHTGAYSQHRADSPVYQRVLPGRPVHYQIGVGTAGAYDEAAPYDEGLYYDGLAAWDLGSHLIDELSQSADWGAQRVKITTLGQEVLLTDTRASVALQALLRTDQAVGLLLDACGWPAGKRAISLSDTTLLYWWADEVRPWDALLQLLGAEGPGTFYVARDGVFHWENRNYRAIAPRAQTSQATYAATSAGSALRFRSLSYDPGYHMVHNRATYPTKRRELRPLAKVWSYGASLTLGPNVTRTLIARASDPFLNAVPPVVGTDYTVTSGTATITMVYSAGFAAFLEVHAGVTGAQVDGPTASPAGGLQLRAQPLAVVSETLVENSIDASASIATFSPVPGAAIPIPLAISAWPEVDPAMAIAVCDAWVSRYQAPRALVTIALPAVDLVSQDDIVRRAVSDRVTLIEPNTGLANDAWVNALTLQVAGAVSPSVELTLGCELCDTLVGAVWESAVWDHPAAVWGT